MGQENKESSCSIPTDNSTSSKMGDAGGAKGGNALTRSRAFRSLVDKAFDMCDHDRQGEISKSELYSGLLLVHLNLAKYAGPAACYPPSRQVCDQLFDAADADKSGSIDKKEFVKIMGITCAQILSRITVYYLVLILLVPLLATRAVDRLGIPNGSYQEMATEQMIGLALFFVVIPSVWNTIDQYSEHHLEQKSKDHAQSVASASSNISTGKNTTTTTTKED